MSKLRVWFDTFNWIIAHSPKDAARVYQEHTGSDWEENNEDEEFILWDKPEYTMLYEDDPSENKLPENAEVGKYKHDGDMVESGLWWVKASAQAWINYTGRGFLGCADF